MSMLINLPWGQKIILAHTFEVPVCKGFGLFAIWTWERQYIMEAVKSKAKLLIPRFEREVRVDIPKLPLKLF